MKKRITLAVFCLGFSAVSSGQVAFSDSTSATNPMDIEACAILQLNSEDKGLLLPRAQTEAIDVTTSNATASGMMTYDPVDRKFYLKTDAGWIVLH